MKYFPLNLLLVEFERGWCLHGVSMTDIETDDEANNWDFYLITILRRHGELLFDLCYDCFTVN